VSHSRIIFDNECGIIVEMFENVKKKIPFLFFLLLGVAVLIKPPKAIFFNFVIFYRHHELFFKFWG
jgi:hypothetical protein